MPIREESKTPLDDLVVRLLRLPAHHVLARSSRVRSVASGYLQVVGEASGIGRDFVAAGASISPRAPP
jgi:hypothetical protein